VEYKIRPVNRQSEKEINTIIAFAMMTIWETCQEAREKPENIPNFNFDIMKINFMNAMQKADHRYLVAVNDSGDICGHCIFKMSVDKNDVPYGYCWTRYVLPLYRRQGIARAFLEKALVWFKEKEATYVKAHTHRSNEPLMNLFKSFNFEVKEISSSKYKWPTNLLKLEF